MSENVRTLGVVMKHPSFTIDIYVSFFGGGSMATALI